MRQRYASTLSQKSKVIDEKNGLYYEKYWSLPDVFGRSQREGKLQVKEQWNLSDNTRKKIKSQRSQACLW